MAKHYVNETGSDFLLDTGVLIGTATEYYIKYKNAAGVEGSWSASLYSSYSSLAVATGTYYLKRTLVYGDLNIPGDWKFQAYVAAMDGTWYGELAKITIYDEFQ